MGAVDVGDGAVRYERRGRTAHVTFARPEARNAMTWTMYEQLQEACRRIRQDDEVRLAVLRGEGGRAFVAGTDIGQFTAFRAPEDGIAYEKRMEAVITDLESIPKPTVAVVDGYAVGGGFMIAAVCDMRICTPDARFGLPIARTLGNCLSMENYGRLVALLGAATTKALVMRAEFVPATAAPPGLVTEVVERDRLDDRVAELCATIEGHAPLTMWATKEAVRRIGHGDTDGADIIETVYGSVDFKEGVSAFLEKREARWVNR